MELILFFTVGTQVSEILF